MKLPARWLVSGHARMSVLYRVRSPEYRLLTIFRCRIVKESRYERLEEVVVMLVSFTVENWKSYHGPTTLSMIADRSRQHRETLAAPRYYHGLRILPIAAFYGGNAAGKTNFLDALRFVQEFVSHGYQDSTFIPVEPFAAGKGYGESSSFSIQMLVGQPKGSFCPARIHQPELIYQLDFEVTRSGVTHEVLSWYDSKQEEHILYMRDADGVVTLADELKAKLDAKTGSLLEAIAVGTGPRRLFLTNVAGQGQSVFLPVYEWFQDVLHNATTSMRSARVTDLMDDETYSKQFGRIMHALGTGVDRIELEQLDLEALPPELQPWVQSLASQISDDAMMQLMGGPTEYGDPATQIYTVQLHAGIPTVKRVQTYRHGQPFGLYRESSGTRRLLEILPVFLDLWLHTNRVWTLDEVEREFHTDMTKELLQGFLDGCTNSTRTQVLLSTHDLMLMDQDIFRKDEIIVVERDAQGNSSLHAIGDYAGVRNDLDLRRSYLDGRFGGKPSIDSNEFQEAVDVCSQKQ